MIRIIVLFFIICETLLVKCQNQIPTQCQCNDLDNCVNEERTILLSCTEKCGKKFITGGNKTLQCIKNRENDQYDSLNNLKLCVETAAGRSCHNSSSRVQNKNQILYRNVRDQPTLNIPGIGIFDEKSLLSGQAKNEMSNYSFCLERCLTEKSRGSNVTRTPPFGGTGRFGWFYGTCPHVLNCFLPTQNININPDGVEKCFNQTKPYSIYVDKKFCTCLMDTYRSKDVTCNY